MRMPAKTVNMTNKGATDSKHWLLELNEAFAFIIWIINAIVFGYIAI